MISNLIKTLRFEKAYVEFEGSAILQSCDFDFPMNTNCRLVFGSDKEKFFFYQAVSQVEGFKKGKFLINDDDVSEFSFEEFLDYRLKIGFGFSTRGLIHNLTLRQNLALPLRYHKLVPENEISEWVDYYGEFFNIENDMDKRPSDVSTSSQKSALIIRAFIHKPELVFLDTPELMLSNKLHASLLQLIDEQRKVHNLKHLFFSTANEDLSDCLNPVNIILEKKRLKLVELKNLKRFAS